MCFTMKKGKKKTPWLTKKRQKMQNKHGDLSGEAGPGLLRQWRKYPSFSVSPSVIYLAIYLGIYLIIYISAYGK